MNAPQKIHVEATYATNHPKIYQGNPFCEALSYLRSYTAIRDALRNPKLTIDTALRSEPAHDRLSLIPQLKKFYEPASRDIGLYIAIRDQMFAIYRDAEISDASYFEKVTRVHEPEPPEIITDGAASYEPSPVAIIGPSGSGKSTVIKRICATIPQVIRHKQYNDNFFFVSQVPWIKVSVPGNASLLSFFKDAFQRYDALLGTRYLRTHGRGSITDQIQSFVRVVVIHGTALIVVDNIDQLATGKSGGKDALINHLYNLVERTRAMLIFVGTEPAEEVISNRLPQVRRLEEVHCPKWGPLEFKEWEKIFEVLWTYQLTEDFTILTEDIIQEFYRWTLGSLSVTITLFSHVQRFVIKARKQRKHERIDIACIAEVGRQTLPRTTQLLTLPLALRLKAERQAEEKRINSTANNSNGTSATRSTTGNDCANEHSADNVAAAPALPKKRKSKKDHPVNQAPDEKSEQNYQRLLAAGIIQDGAPE